MSIYVYTYSKMSSKLFNEGEDKMEKSVNFKDILKEMEELYDKKNNDYGNSFDNSIDEFGIFGVVVRLNDKMNRLKHLTKGGEQKVKDESIYDTFLDMANYSAMTCAYLRSKGKI